VILKRFSLLIGSNDVVCYGKTYIPTLWSGIGRHFKRSVEMLIGHKRWSKLTEMALQKATCNYKQWILSTTAQCFNSSATEATCYDESSKVIRLFQRYA